MIFSLVQYNPVIAVAYVLVLAICITVHEFAHAFAAYALGDSTAKDAGRLTLNPIAHLDPIGSLMLLVAGIGWGRPTPYNPYNLKYRTWGPALVAVAGPVSNLIVAVASLLFLAAVAPYYDAGNLLIFFLTYLFLVNLMLMVFNLLPIPPLDGSQILFTILPARFNAIKYFLAKNGLFILIAVILLDGVLSQGLFSRIYSFFLSIVRGVIG